MLGKFLEGKRVVLLGAVTTRLDKDFDVYCHTNNHHLENFYPVDILFHNGAPELSPQRMLYDEERRPSYVVTRCDACDWRAWNEVCAAYKIGCQGYSENEYLPSPMVGTWAIQVLLKYPFEYLWVDGMNLYRGHKCYHDRQRHKEVMLEFLEDPRVAYCDGLMKALTEEEESS